MSELRRPFQPKALLFSHGGRRSGDALQPIPGGELGGPMVFLSQAQSEAPGQGLLDRADALSTDLDEKNQAGLLKRG